MCGPSLQKNPQNNENHHVPPITEMITSLMSAVHQERKTVLQNSVNVKSTGNACICAKAT